MQNSLGIQASDSSNGIPESKDLVDPTGAEIPPGASVVDGKIQITGNNGTANAIDVTSMKVVPPATDSYH